MGRENTVDIAVQDSHYAAVARGSCEGTFATASRRPEFNREARGLRMLASVCAGMLGSPGFSHPRPAH
jgi:hypothetical protein